MYDLNLLAPLSEAAPCGADLEYDVEFLALERALDGAYAERAVGPEGEAVAPDWRVIAERALALSDRSRDLRVAVAITRAWLHLDGLYGLARGLSLLHSLLTEHWEFVHPQLGAQGDTTGLMRVAALRNLCDARTVIATLRSAPLVSAPGAATLCLRDLEKVHTNRQPEPGAADAAQVDAVFRGCDIEALRGVYRAAVAARVDAAALESTFAEQPGVSALRLTDLITQLEAIDAQLAPRLAACEAAREDAEPSTANRAERPTQIRGASRARLQPSAASGLVRSREDVVRELERLCAYYEQYEPSSPIPILLSRAKRLAGMHFMDIVRELAPAGLAEIATLRGPITTEES